MNWKEQACDKNHNLCLWYQDAKTAMPQRVKHNVCSPESLYVDNVSEITEAKAARVGVTGLIL